MNTAKLFERSLSGFWPESERSKSFAVFISLQNHAHRDFDQLRLDFPEIAKYFPVPGTLN